MANPTPPPVSPDLAPLLAACPALSLSPHTQSLFLRLPPPHNTILLTGPLPTDVPLITAAFNNPAIYPYTVGTPFPYLPAHGEELLARNQRSYEAMAGAMAALAGAGREVRVDGTPLRFIREEQADGTWAFVGDVGLNRCSFAEVDDEEERERLVAENERREVGDPEIIWMIGDWLLPALHGRGIMTAAIRTVLHDWASLMNCRCVRAYILTGNEASKRVFEKLGFALVHTRAGGVPRQGKREREVGTWTMELRAG